MKLKEFLVIRNHDDNMEVWTRAEYEKYISDTLGVGACPAVSIITHFNWEDSLLKDNIGEELKEGGGMRSDQAVMAFAHHMNKQRGYETVHGTMY